MRSMARRAILHTVRGGSGFLRTGTKHLLIMVLFNSTWTQSHGSPNTPNLEGKTPTEGFLSRPKLILAFYSIGGNLGKVNSFAGVDLSDLTGGVFNLANLLEGNNLLCFVFEVLKFASPNALSGLYKTLAEPLEFVTNVVAEPLLNLTCPAFKDLQMGGKPLWEALKDDFPGAMKGDGAF